MQLFAIAVALVIILGIQNWVYRKYALQNVKYRCYLSKDQVFEGEEIELIEELENRKWLPLPWFKTEITASRWLDFAGTQSQLTDKSRFVPSFFSLRSYQKVSRRWKVRCLKRGEYSIDRVVLVTSDLLGNVNQSIGAEVHSSVLVLPRPIGEIEGIKTRHLTGDLVVRRTLVEDPFYFSGVREYMDFDPMNRIHWPATAREQKLMVFQNDSTTRQSVTIALNMQSRALEHGSTAIDREKMETAIRLCAGLFTSTLSTGMPLRFAANCCTSDARDTIFTEEYWGTDHVEGLLQLLARLQLRSTEEFFTFLSDHYHDMTSTDLVFVTGFLDEHIIEVIRRKQYDGVHVRTLLLGEIPPELDTGGCEILELSPADLEGGAAA
ncbi:MAG: DUF58 domain-containing protein [Candidatus Merdivicinus sp.]|jgi:uncharacterized protein (DUF58 family)